MRKVVWGNMTNIRGFNFDIEKILKALKKVVGDEDVKSYLMKSYIWPRKNSEAAYERAPVSKIEKENLGASFDGNVALKTLIYKKLNSGELTEQAESEICAWVIRDWGGITTSKMMIEDEYEKASNFYQKLINEKILILPFERIASVSKYAAFKDIKNYVIYDARVIASLNWLLLKVESAFYFPSPDGRNPALNAFDVGSILRLVHAEKYKVDEVEKIQGKFISKRDAQLYIPKNKSYRIYCELLKQLNSNLWESQSDDMNWKVHPFYIEMLLFAIADRAVLKDIVDSVEVKINQPKYPS